MLDHQLFSNNILFLNTAQMVYFCVPGFYENEKYLLLCRHLEVP